MSESIPIILLKTKSSPVDPYHEYFSSHPFNHTHRNPTPANPIFVPVLQHHHVNLDLLESLITARKISSSISEQTQYSGLIITSQRAVEALGVVLDKLKPSKAVDALFASTKVYSVGPATSAAIVALGFAEGNVLGQNCGTGALLGKVIVHDHPAGQLPLLFLINEKRGDVIPRILGEAGVGFEEMIVYETKVMDGFREEFTEVMERTKEAAVRWVVVFSPSGADVALDVLGEGMETGTLLATIGPTTEEHLVAKLGRKPEVVAGTPSPEGLWNGLAEFMEKRHGVDKTR